MNKSKRVKVKEWHKKYPNGKAELSWVKIDYEVFDYETPERIIKNPEKTEGEMMNDGEIEQWFIDNLKTLPVIKEEHPELFPELYRNFCLDIEYLFSINRIGEDVVEFVFNKSNFDFGG